MENTLQRKIGQVLTVAAGLAALLASGTFDHSYSIQLDDQIEESHTDWWGLTLAIFMAVAFLLAVASVVCYSRGKLSAWRILIILGGVLSLLAVVPAALFATAFYFLKPAKEVSKSP